jgi:hypothetical protein
MQKTIQQIIWVQSKLSIMEISLLGQIPGWSFKFSWELWPIHHVTSVERAGKVENLQIANFGSDYVAFQVPPIHVSTTHNVT